jgi:hypothetical protein
MGSWPDFPASVSAILFYLTSRKLPRVGHFDILVTSLLSFSQARPTSWRVSGKSQGEFMNNITLFAAF